MLAKLLEKGHSNPKSIFLIDAFGALATFLILRFVLPNFVTVLGIPRSTLTILATFPVLYFIYDLACYFVVRIRIAALLKGIALLNIMYCLVSMGFSIYHKGELTVLGWGYVLAEIFLIFAIALYEWKVASLV